MNNIDLEGPGTHTLTWGEGGIQSTALVYQGVIFFVTSFGYAFFMKYFFKSCASFNNYVSKYAAFSHKKYFIKNAYPKEVTKKMTPWYTNAVL